MGSWGYPQKAQKEWIREREAEGDSLFAARYGV
jgi:hypothetical protein